MKINLKNCIRKNRKIKIKIEEKNNKYFYRYTYIIFD